MNNQQQEQQENNRSKHTKILEGLSYKTQQLQKGIIPPRNPQPQIKDPIVNSTTRAAFNQAQSTSFGYFVEQDSAYGNSILPVLPRSYIRE